MTMKNQEMFNQTLAVQRATGDRPPRVSIGMPVFNGDNYLAEALDSLLAQSFGDFELIISDNGSTDTTPEICARYSSKDSRIKYYRSDENRGAAWNFNRVFALANGDYFMWAAHDDLWDTKFLEKCVSVLDEKPEAVLCCARTQVITDARDHVDKDFAVHPGLSSSHTHERFAAGWRLPPQIPVFGLIRRKVLAQTRLIGSYSASDQILVSELALLGPFHSLQEPLFFYRRHDQQSTASPHPTMRSRMAWFNPKNNTRLTFPHWRLLREHFIAIWRANSATTGERLYCCVSLLRWMLRKRRFLLNDLIFRDVRACRNYQSTLE